MDSRKIVYRETAVVAVGELALSAVTVGVFAALGYFTWAVLWGALAGCLVAIGNHFFLCVAVSLAADKAEQGKPAEGQKIVKGSYSIRLVAIGVVVFVAVKLGANALALLLPLLYVRPVLLLAEFFRKKGD